MIVKELDRRSERKHMGSHMKRKKGGFVDFQISINNNTNRQRKNKRFKNDLLGYHELVT